MVSASQSSATDLTHCWWPEVSPLTQYSWRLRDQYVQRPVVSVRCSASSSIQPTISTSPVSYCCATAATRPLASRLSRAAIFGSRFDGRTASVIFDTLFCSASGARRCLPAPGGTVTAYDLTVTYSRDERLALAALLEETG